LLQFIEVGEDFGGSPVGGTYEFSADDSVFIDDVGFGWADRSVGEVAFFRRVEDSEQVDVVVGDVGLVGVFVVVEADGKDDDVGHVALELDERREFFEAGGAPGGPEVEDYDFASVVG